jgi:hypothetical protein
MDQPLDRTLTVRLRGAIYHYAESTPATPSDAKTYDNGPTTVDETLKTVSAVALLSQRSSRS